MCVACCATGFLVHNNLRRKVWNLAPPIVLATFTGVCLMLPGLLAVSFRMEQLAAVKVGHAHAVKKCIALHAVARG